MGCLFFILMETGSNPSNPTAQWAVGQPVQKLAVSLPFANGKRAIEPGTRTNKTGHPLRVPSFYETMKDRLESIPTKKHPLGGARTIGQQDSIILMCRRHPAAEGQSTGLSHLIGSSPLPIPTKKHPQRGAFSLVRATGLEPARFRRGT